LSTIDPPTGEFPKETPPQPPLPLPPDWRARLHDFDRQVDELADRLRGHPVADRLFYTASEVGDFSVLWHLFGALRGLTNDRRADEAFRLSALLAAESLMVNGVIKSFFRRTRPEWEQERAYKIRRPRSSSFPSGHASAAFFAATVMGEGSAAWPLYYGAAAVVASSRVYVKIHHGSDVVAGAVTGMVLGRIARRAWRKPH
jgi:undecaprenyl-diphosphatase